MRSCSRLRHCSPQVWSIVPGMSRAELVRSVFEGLPTRSASVSFPDHPLLLRGPDLLALINRELTAYFVISQRTRQIVSRVVLSRLAYPPRTSFVAVLDRSVTLDGEYAALFEEVVEVSNTRAMSFPAGAMRRSAGAEILDSVRFLHHERYAEAWAVTTKRWHRKRKIPGEPSSLYAMIQARPTVRYTDFHDGSFIFVPPDSTSWRILNPSLSSVTDVATRYDYNLIQGITGLSEIARLANTSNAHLALHHSRMNVLVRSSGFDALKPYRAAAFAGFATEDWRYSDDV
jgi:hypothetical protein